MPSWNSRLVVQVGAKTISPIASFITTFATSTTQIHSIEADNVGVIQKPRTMTFTMSVPAIQDPTQPNLENAAALYQLAIDGQPFDVALNVQSGTDWVFKSLVFGGCFITSASPSNVSVGTTSGLLDTTPVATFSGIVTSFGDANVTAA
jgi:hypothetical protein